MNELALFAGAGGGILGGELLGWRTVCAVEINPYCASVLMQRQNDGILPPFPIWGDVRTFDGSKWRGIVDVVSGGFPCNDISAIKRNAQGIDGEKSGLWVEMARVISEVQPRFVIIENSPLLRTRGLDKILKDLAEMGFDAKWGMLRATDVGAPHKRERIWIVAHARSERSQGKFPSRSTGWTTGRICGESTGLDKVSLLRPLYVRDPLGFTRIGVRLPSTRHEGKYRTFNYGPLFGSDTWEPFAGSIRVATRLAARVDRLKAIGNGQVPRVVKLAWKMLTQDTDEALDEIYK